MFRMTRSSGGGGSLDKAIETIKKYKDNPSYQPTEEELKQMANFVVTHGGKAILNEACRKRYYLLRMVSLVADFSLASKR